MAFVQVPPDSTGKKVDTNTIGLTERQIAIIGDAVSSSGLAVVTTSAGLMVNVSSGLVTLSSNPTIVSASSGVVQVLTSGPLTLSGTVTIVSASSGLVQALTSGTLIMVSASSGLVQTLTSGTLIIVSASSGAVQTLTSGALVLSSAGITQIIPVTSSGVNLYTTAGINTVITGTSGAAVTMTSSGALPVAVLGGVLLTSPSMIQLAAQTTGITSFVYVSSSSGNSNNVKNSQGVFFGFYAFNSTNAARYLKVYGTSSSPTVGSTAAQIGNYGIPANSGSGGAGAQHVIMPFGVLTTAGVAFTIVSGVEATSTGSIGASDIGLTLYYI